MQVLFGLEFAYVIDTVKKKMKDKILESGITIPDPIFADVSCFNIDPPEIPLNGERSVNSKSDDQDCSCSIGGLTWSMPAGSSMEHYLIFWIGSENPAFMNAVLMFNSCETGLRDFNHFFMVLTYPCSVMTERVILF